MALWRSWVRSPLGPPGKRLAKGYLCQINNRITEVGRSSRPSASEPGGTGESPAQQPQTAFRLNSPASPSSLRHTLPVNISNLMPAGSGRRPIQPTELAWLFTWQAGWYRGTPFVPVGERAFFFNVIEYKSGCLEDEIKVCVIEPQNIRTSALIFRTWIYER